MTIRSAVLGTAELRRTELPVTGPEVFFHNCQIANLEPLAHPRRSSANSVLRRASEVSLCGHFSSQE